MTKKMVATIVSYPVDLLYQVRFWERSPQLIETRTSPPCPCSLSSCKTLRNIWRSNLLHKPAEKKQNTVKLGCVITISTQKGYVDTGSRKVRPRS